MQKSASDLTAKQAAYVAVRLAAPSIAAAATQAGISVRSARRFESLPHVAAAIRAEQRRAIDTASLRSVGLVAVALDGLESIASDELTPPGVRVAAWRYVIDTALRLNEASDLSERLSRLEEILHNTKDE